MGQELETRRFSRTQQGLRHVQCAGESTGWHPRQRSHPQSRHVPAEDTGGRHAICQRRRPHAGVPGGPRRRLGSLGFCSLGLGCSLCLGGFALGLGWRVCCPLWRPCICGGLQDGLGWSHRLTLGSPGGGKGERQVGWGTLQQAAVAAAAVPGRGGQHCRPHYCGRHEEGPKVQVGSSNSQPAPQHVIDVRTNCNRCKNQLSLPPLMGGSASWVYKVCIQQGLLWL